MSNKSIIGYRVIADFEKNKVIAKESDRKTPVFMSCEIDKLSMAEALRAIAYAALDKAHFMTYQTPSTYDNMDDQYKKMMHENTLFYGRA